MQKTLSKSESKTVPGPTFHKISQRQVSHKLVRPPSIQPTSSISFHRQSISLINRSKCKHRTSQSAHFSASSNDPSNSNSGPSCPKQSSQSVESPDFFLSMQSSNAPDLRRTSGPSGFRENLRFKLGLKQKSRENRLSKLKSIQIFDYMLSSRLSPPPQNEANQEAIKKITGSLEHGGKKTPQTQAKQKKQTSSKQHQSKPHDRTVENSTSLEQSKQKQEEKSNSLLVKVGQVLIYPARVMLKTGFIPNSLFLLFSIGLILQIAAPTNETTIEDYVSIIQQTFGHDIPLHEKLKIDRMIDESRELFQEIGQLQELGLEPTDEFLNKFNAHTFFRNYWYTYANIRHFFPFNAFYLSFPACFTFSILYNSVGKLFKATVQNNPQKSESTTTITSPINTPIVHGEEPISTTFTHITETHSAQSSSDSNQALKPIPATEKI